ncbi:carboxylesterase/lipase family protein [Streptomyces sp. NPDC048254]|uniref:carboxylesterase/lipase family protein n=1 Tax=Streptomyces sp. NPDC048254 TaxID=3365525 RepID=UPI0037247C7C
MTTAESHEPVRSAEPESCTTAGRVRGRWEGGLAVFRGIPYAAPPVGEARFQAPRPVPGWDGTREAHAFGPPPPQEAAFQGRTGAPDLPGGDDWLTVNVWTPDPGPTDRRPVMVWIHGGAYKLGFSGSPGYDARHIARDGDLVVVTLNYRLGIEGFAHIDGAPANRGLLDQVAALEWVRENIAAFGGDPGQVTVFGESAGAGSIAALLAMPRAAGLFRRAIAQSVPGTYFSDDLARDIATALATEAGLRPTVAGLAGVDPRQLPAAGEILGARMRQYEDRWGQLARTQSLFSPVVDGEVLPATPWQALSNGTARDVELIIGHNRDEFRLFVALSGQLGKIGDDQATEALRVFGPGPDGERAYREAFLGASAGELYELVQTDWLFRMPSLRLAEAQVTGGGRAHVYELTWQAPGNGGAFGACHGLDGTLLFGTFDAHLGPLLLGPEPSAEARSLSSRFRATWTAFATTGDPGWPAYDPDRRLVQVLDSDPVVTAYPEETSRRLWQDHDFPALPLIK